MIQSISHTTHVLIQDIHIQGDPLINQQISHKFYSAKSLRTFKTGKIFCISSFPSKGSRMRVDIFDQSCKCLSIFGGRPCIYVFIFIHICSWMLFKCIIFSSRISYMYPKGHENCSYDLFVILVYLVGDDIQTFLFSRLNCYEGKVLQPSSKLN